GAVAVPGERDAAKGFWPRAFRQRDIGRKLIPGKQPDHCGAGLEEGDGLARRAKFSDEAQRLIERDADGHVVDTERDGGEPRNRNRPFRTHVTSPSALAPSFSSPRTG